MVKSFEAPRGASLLQDRRMEWLLFAIIILFSGLWGLYVLRRFGMVMSCLDAGSHLYIPKVVVHNGGGVDFENLGTVWLPGFHLLVMPLVLIRPLYTTGGAGALINSLFLAGSGVLTYRFLGGWAGMAAALIFALNPYSLVYATSPMSELSGIFFLLLGVYLFKGYWERGYYRYWVYTGLALGFGTLIRYEVWPVAGAVSGLYLFRVIRGRRYRELPLGLLPFYGMGLWFLYNRLFFGSGLAFLTHPGAREPLDAYYFGSFYLSVKHFLHLLNHLSGWLWIPALVGWLCSSLRYPGLCIAIGLTALAGGIHIPLGVLGRSLGFVRFVLYTLPLLSIAGMVPISMIKGLRARLGWLAVLLLSLMPAIPSLSKMISRGENLHIAGATHMDVDYPGVARILEESRRIMAEVDSFPLLLSTQQARQFLSLASGEPPARFFDGYDCPEYLALAERPWEYFPTVLIDPLRASDSLWQEYSAGRYFNYRYFADHKFREEFLTRYRLILEAGGGLLFRRHISDRCL